MGSVRPDRAVRAGSDWLREVAILIVRMHSLGVVLGLWFLATLGFSPLTLAEGAVSRASGYSAPVKRPLFRPWGGLESTSFSVRPRSQVNPVSRQAANAWTPARQEVFSDRRVGGRKAVPVTRGQRSPC